MTDQPKEAEELPEPQEAEEAEEEEGEHYTLTIAEEDADA